jgi:hypothetical protein
MPLRLSLLILPLDLLSKGEKKGTRIFLKGTEMKKEIYKTYLTTTEKQGVFRVPVHQKYRLLNETS